MKTPKRLPKTMPTVYPCELESCPRCEGPPVERPYLNGLKVVPSRGRSPLPSGPNGVLDPQCLGHPVAWPSAQWQQVAPWYCTYGYDVIAQIGWQRQTGSEQFAQIHQVLRSRIQISESQSLPWTRSRVRYLYHQLYLPLVACHERQQLDRLKRVADQSGLILALDGLAPEGGEPQLCPGSSPGCKPG